MLKPYTRAPAFLLGVLLAFIFQSVRNIRIFVFIRVIIYIFIWCTLIFLFFISYTAYTNGWEEWMNILFVGFAHPLFSIVTAMSIYLMAYGFEGPLNLRRFFGSTLWVPYSRVTYGVYLYAPMIIEMVFFSFLLLIFVLNSLLTINKTYASVQVNRSYALYEVIFMFFGFVVVSYIGGLLNYLIVEAPFIKLYDNFVSTKR